MVIRPLGKLRPARTNSAMCLSTPIRRRYCPQWRRSRTITLPTIATIIPTGFISRDTSITKVAKTRPSLLIISLESLPLVRQPSGKIISAMESVYRVFPRRL